MFGNRYFHSQLDKLARYVGKRWYSVKKVDDQFVPTVSMRNPKDYVNQYRGVNSRGHFTHTHK